jgi:hypothetical protein
VRTQGIGPFGSQCPKGGDEGEGREGGVRGRAEKEEEKEMKEKIEMKVSTEFQINPSTNG